VLLETTRIQPYKVYVLLIRITGGAAITDRMNAEISGFIKSNK